MELLRDLRRIVVGLSALVAVSLAPMRDVVAANHALLIGISDYSESGLQSLKGPDNDISLMRSVLRQRFGMSEEEIVVLLNAQATHTAIEKAFADLAGRVKPGDFVYIHYSGHGSYAVDKNDRSGFDQTWVPYGARARKAVGLDDHDVLDKEINQWLQPLYKITPNVVFVSDSCHSATVARGVARSGIRAAPPDPRPHPLIGKPFAPSAAMPGLRIGAARDVESAIEVDTEDGGACIDSNRCHGVFTWYWAQSLQRASPGDLWRDVFNRAYTLIVTRPYVLQRPQEEGHSDTLVFGGRFAAWKPTIAVTAVDAKAATVQLSTGSVSGVTPGSVYRLYDPSRPGAFGPAQVEVADVDAFTARGKIRNGTLAVGNALIEETHAYPFKPIRLYVQADSPANADIALLARMDAALRKLPGFEIAANRSDAIWTVYLFRPDPATAAPARNGQAVRPPPSRAGKPLEAWVLDRQGALLQDQLRIPMSDPSKGVDGLSANLTRFARAREIKNLESVGTTPHIAADITVFREDASCTHGCFYLPSDSRKTRPYRTLGTWPIAKVSSMAFRRGDALSLSLRNVDADKKAWYAYLLDIGSNSVIQALFPTRYDNSDAALLNAGESRNLADDTVLVLDAVGVETIKLITTAEPIDVHLFESPLAAETRGNTNPLERLLIQAMTSRGRVERKSVSDWATQQASFDVK